jgi:hypothetical protein
MFNAALEQVRDVFARGVIPQVAHRQRSDTPALLADYAHSRPPSSGQGHVHQASSLPQHLPHRSSHPHNPLNPTQ